VLRTSSFGSVLAITGNFLFHPAIVGRLLITTHFGGWTPDS
jgi:hypothetical protein